MLHHDEPREEKMNTYFNSLFCPTCQQETLLNKKSAFYCTSCNKPYDLSQLKAAWNEAIAQCYNELYLRKLTEEKNYE